MKKICCLIICLCMIFALCSCGTNTNVSELEGKIEALEKENQELRNKIAQLQGDMIDDEANTENKDKNSSEKTVQLKTPFSVGNIMNITLNSTEWCDKILPSNTSGAYSYMGDKENEKYFVIHGKIESLASENFDINYSNETELLINGKYKVSAKMETEESDGTSFYGSIKPLQTLNFVIYASVSDTLYNQWENISVSMKIANNEEDLNGFFDSSTKYDSFNISFQK